MSFSLPPGFSQTIRAFLIGCGDSVVFRQQGGGAVLNLVGSVQRPGTTTLIGDVIQEGFVVYLPGDAFGAIIPAKFDRIQIDGENRTVERALPIQAGNITHAWQIDVTG